MISRAYLDQVRVGRTMFALVEDIDYLHLNALNDDDWFAAIYQDIDIEWFDEPVEYPSFGIKAVGMVEDWILVEKD